MFCPNVFQSTSSAMRPVRSLWPETRPLFYQMEQQMLRNLQEIRHNMEYMERFHQKIFEESDLSTSSSSGFKPISFQVLQDSDTFSLTLDTKDFSAEELSIKQVGRKLHVRGQTKKKQDDGRGSYSYCCQEFRQEVDFPLGMDAEAVTCSLVGGQLLVQSPRKKIWMERVIPISFIQDPAITGIHHDTHTDTHSDTQ